MWFKNLQIYRLAQPLDYSAQELHARMEQARFVRCRSLDVASQGWAPPLGRQGKQFVHECGGNLMVCMRREEKVLPPSVIQEIVNERVEEIEIEQMRSVSRKEKTTIRDNVILELIPRALSRSFLRYAYIDPQHAWLVVDAASAKKAEELIDFLRQTLGSFPVKPLAVNSAPAQVMTAWLSSGDLDRDFSVQDECELRDADSDGGIVRCRRQDLTGEEIHSHLQAGKQVVKLALEWDERLTCLLSDDLSIKRLRFSDVVQEEAAAGGADDDAARFDADLALMSLELSRFIPRLLDLFGGEHVAANSPQ